MSNTRVVHDTRIMRDAHRRRIVPVMANRHQRARVLVLALAGPDPRDGRPAAQPRLAAAPAALNHDVVEREPPVRVRLDGGLFGCEPARPASVRSEREGAGFGLSPPRQKRRCLPQRRLAHRGLAVVPSRCFLRGRRRIPTEAGQVEPRVPLRQLLGREDAVDEARAARAAEDAVDARDLADIGPDVERKGKRPQGFHLRGPVVRGTSLRVLQMHIAAAREVESLRPCPPRY